MANKFMITREEYKHIKRKDHKQMEEYLLNLYNIGLKDGKEAAGTKRIKSSDIAIAISEVKGIGTKKAAEIMAAVNTLYTQKNNSTERKGDKV